MKIQKPPIINLVDVMNWLFGKRESQGGNYYRMVSVGKLSVSDHREAQRDADVAYYEPLIQQAYSKSFENGIEHCAEVIHPVIIQQAKDEVAREMIEEIKKSLLTDEDFLEWCGSHNPIGCGGTREMEGVDRTVSICEDCRAQAQLDKVLKIVEEK